MSNDECRMSKCESLCLEGPSERIARSDERGQPHSTFGIRHFGEYH